MSGVVNVRGGESRGGECRTIGMIMIVMRILMLMTIMFFLQP